MASAGPGRVARPGVRPPVGLTAPIMSVSVAVGPLAAIRRRAEAGAPADRRTADRIAQLRRRLTEQARTAASSRTSSTGDRTVGGTGPAGRPAARHHRRDGPPGRPDRLRPLGRPGPGLRPLLPPHPAPRLLRPPAPRPGGWSTPTTAAPSPTASPTSAAATAAPRCARPARTSTRATCGTSSTPAPPAASKTSPTPSRRIRWTSSPSPRRRSAGCTPPAAPAEPCHPRRGRQATFCPHGRPEHCPRVHRDDDPDLGTPLCPDCYDYAGQVAFNWYAPELWRRFTITLRRRLADRLGIPRTQLRELRHGQLREGGRVPTPRRRPLPRPRPPRRARRRLPAARRCRSPLSSWPTPSRPPPPRPT